MELYEAEGLANRLLEEFGLYSWSFKFDNARSRFGCCWFRKKCITLSRALVLLNEQAIVEDTLRHEIAHALAPPRSGHGAAWKAVCRRIGAKPECCYKVSEITSVGTDWHATCAGCGTIHKKFRVPRNIRWCAVATCRAQHGRRQDIQRLAWERTV